MADNTTDSDVDAFMLATTKAGMRAAMDLGTASTTDATAYATAANGLTSAGPILSINGGDPATFDVAAGSGVLGGVAFSWGAQSAIAVTNLATATRTYVSISSGGAVVQSTTAPTPTSRRANLFLGQLGHANFTTIANAVNAPDYAPDGGDQFRDWLRCLGVYSCSGNGISANGANLSIDIAAGELFGSGINQESSATSPNNKSFSALTPATFRRRTVTGLGENAATTLDVGNYDDGTAITAISGTKYQNFRVYRLTSGNIVVQYGRAVYTSMNLAVDAITSETFEPFSNVVGIGAQIGIITVRSTATDLTDSAQARFSQAVQIAGSQVTGVGGTPAAHAASHTDGTDDIQDATASQKGLATAAQITKLDGIEALADVTAAANITAVLDAAPTSDAIAGFKFVAVGTSGPVDGVLYALPASDVQAANAALYVPINGALGTPTSGTATNLSGTAASLTAGIASKANALTASGGFIVDVSAASVPSTGQILTATSPSTATWQAPAAALGLKTATTTVAVDSATAPTTGQVLTATSSTAATWQTPSGGSGVDVTVVATKGGTDQTDTYTANTYITVAFGTEVQDDGGDFASSTLTVASGEVWLITGAVSAAPTGNAHSHMLALFKDGTIEKKLNVASGYSVPYVTQPFSTIISAAGDYTIRMTFSISGSRTIEGDATDTYLICRRLK